VINSDESLGILIRTLLKTNEESKQVINLQLVALISIQNTHTRKKKKLPRYIIKACIKGK